MSNERPDEFLSWRGPLTRPDALPEEGLEDKDVSWERLAERLQKQPRRHVIAWWIAAACLILAFFPATLLFRTRPTRSNRIALHPAQRQSVAPIHRVVQPVGSTTQPAGSTVPPPKPQTAAQPAKSTPAANPTPNPAVQLAAIASPPATIPDPSPASDPAIASTLSPVSAPPITASPSRRPPRIVYLNEISKDPGPPPALASRQPAFLRLSTATAGDWTINQNNTSIIKIEISSPNH